MMFRFSDRHPAGSPFGLAALTLALALPCVAVAGQIVLTPEEPEAGNTYSGVANLRGWAVSSVGIDHIELYINGALYAARTGSSATFKWNLRTYATGNHTLQVVARDAAGNDGVSSLVTVTKK